MSTDVVVNDKTIPEIFNEVAEKSVLNNTPHEEEPLKDDEYEVINERPPIWDDVVNAGLKFNPNTTIFTYGRAIYNPAGIDIPDDLHVHECVHMDQQAKMAGGPDAWWGRYLTDPWFRLSQEAEAYGAQFRYLLYLACLVLLVYALNMFMRLRRTALALHIANITLEQRVSERTADLEKALENLTKTQSQLLQSEKMSAVGQLAAGVAHEINNPLGVILGFAQAVVRKIQPGEPLEAPLKSIEREALRCKSLVQDLLTFSRNGKAERVPLDVNQAVEGAASLIKTQAKTKNVSVIEKLSAQLPHVLADKNKLQQVLINLSNNALDAMPQGGQLTICTELLNETPQSWVVIKVTDNGAGIAPDILPRIFEPFFTTKPVGKGTGLGLSLVYEIVKSHSGTIDVSSRVGYTEFIIKLPVRTGHEMEAKMALERDAPEINKPPSRTQAA
jgi:signal transduction histidine kinase